MGFDRKTPQLCVERLAFWQLELFQIHSTNSKTKYQNSEKIRNHKFESFSSGDSDFDIRASDLPSCASVIRRVSGL